MADEHAKQPEPDEQIPEAPTLPADVAEAALAFLDRTTLRGDEVAAFLRVRASLQAFVQRI